MADLTPERAAALRAAEADHRRVLDSGDHLLQQLRMRDVDPGDADFAVEMDLDTRFANPRGGLQGGLVATLADVVAGRAAHESLGEAATAATADLSLHYLAPVRVGPARAEARALRLGRHLLVFRVDIYDVGARRLSASGTVTYAVLSAARTSSHDGARA